MTNAIKKLGKAVLSAIASSPPQVALVTWMARSGAGTDASLKKGSLPLPVHYYSPVPDIEDLVRRDVWARRSELPGVDFQPDEQVRYLLELGRRFGEECDWPPEPTTDPTEFHTENMSFSFGCAAAAHCVIRASKPRRLIEIGSGMSSMILSAALAQNERDGASPAEYTVIDPYPSQRLGDLTGTKPKVLASRVELVDVEMFQQLDRDDILFIDSGHVVRIGGDVNFLLLDILPRLRPGVVVHFHDIGLPYEYPRVYATNPSFRVFWTEAYLLQAFLAFNQAYEIRLGMAYLTQEHGDVIRAAFPWYDPARHRASSGSFWIARR
ncbi:MAG: class I SAM-dependent methyltransferase [Chloroflexi bacterium]|nr:class I SAM-dependent methyltransferase [Chloroflexota bacterium]